MRRGELIAAVLAGSWRAVPPGPAVPTDQLVGLLPRLFGTPLRSLAWWSVRDSPARSLPGAAELRDAYRYAALEAAIHEENLRELVAALQAAGIQPLLVKGWAVARLYPEPALRPYSDVDLWVPPEQLARAQQAVDALEGLMLSVDLQSEFRYLDDRTLEGVRARAELAVLGDVELSVIGPEDHLRFLAMHMLSDALRNPIWLCDVGAFVESLPAGFDWDYGLSGAPGCSEWVICVLALAHQLLGARLDGAGLPMDVAGYRLPRWLIPAVLHRWGRLGERTLAGTTASYLRQPGLFLEAFRDRWGDPIETTFRWRGAPNDLPRFPYQLGDCLGRAFWFAARSGLSRLRPGAYREPPAAWRRWRPPRPRAGGMRR